MKKIVSFFLTATVIISLCGCSAVSGDTHKYLIASLGFDSEDGVISLTAEAVAVNSEDKSEGKKRILLKGSGESPQEAINNAKNTATQDFDLSHCGVIALGSSLAAEELARIWNWCYDTDEITFSVYMVYCENSAEILSAEPVSSVAAGYDIMSLEKKETELHGTEFKNSLYETQAQMEKALKIFSLPLVALEGKERYIDGIAVFDNYELITLLGGEKALYYSLITDRFSSGSMVSGGENNKIEYCNTTYKASGSGDFKITLKLGAEDKVKDRVKTQAEKLIEASKSEYGDIFGLGNLIYLEKPDLWQKIKDNYSEYYKNLDITVAVK